MNEEQVIDATVPDRSNDPRYWAECYFREYFRPESIAKDYLGLHEWFRRALATGARQALIDVSLIEPCRCSVSPTKYVLMYPKLTIEGERYMLQCQACDVFVRADSIEELRIAWNARMQ